MKILLGSNHDSKVEPWLYRFKPRTMPIKVRGKDKQLLADQESQRVIRKFGP